MNSAQAQSKQSQIVQNFFTKTVQVIAEARLSPEDLRTDETTASAAAASAAPNINKWFNLELRELDFLHESLRPWRQVNIDEHLPPLVVETYLNPSKLRPGQTIVLGDTRCSITKEIVLERWVIEFKASPAVSQGGDGAVGISSEDLPAVYKQAIISIRSLYTAVRLLPTWQLHQKLNRQKLISVPLKIGIRIHNGSLPISSRGRVGLSKSIAEKQSTLQQFRIQPIAMPIGSLHCGVTYRTDVRFGVEDIEKVMAQKFMELDAPGAGQGSAAATASAGTPGSVGSATSFQPGSQASLGPRPILNFTRPFRSPEVGSANVQSLPRSIPSSVNSTGQVAVPQSVSGSASSVISTNSRFSSSFASQKQHSVQPRSFTHDTPQQQQRAGSINSQGSHDSYHNNLGLDPGSGMYMVQSDVGDFVKFVDETRKKGTERMRQTPADVDSTIARFQNMRSSYVQLSDSIMQGSVHQDTTVKPDRPDRRRSSGPRSRLGFYNDREDEDEGDSDLLFALSDMHI